MSTPIRFARAAAAAVVAALLGTMLLSGVAHALPDQRLAWGFGEGSGSAVGDSSPNGRNGVVTGPGWTAGRYGSGVAFDGTSTRVTSVSDVSLGGAFTVEAWVRNPVASGYETVWTVGPDRDLYLVDGVPNFWAGSVNVEFGPALAVDTWQHLAFVSDGSSVSLFVDGVLRGSPRALVLGAVSGRLQVGAWPAFGTNTDLFSGVIDEVRLYGRVLTSAEIASDRTTPIG